MSRLPPWIRLRLSTDQEFNHVHGLISRWSLHTVCESARCPNRHECWNRGSATVMLLGDTCTRSCRFCAVRSGRPAGLDRDEPRRVAGAVAAMQLRHVVLTSVARDDLPDGGAGIFAETIREVRSAQPDVTIEVLTPDFEGREDLLGLVLAAAPDVFNHNLETVARFQPVIRPQASYGRSLRVLQQAAAAPVRPVVKSGLMLGLGETEAETAQALRDLVSVGCELLTLGQYLQPTRDHIPVARFVAPDEFDRLAGVARDIGFLAVASGPLVRSSYRADELYKTALDARNRAAASA
jgi:lipoic acid synthetase